MRELFVWYRVRAERVDAAFESVRAMQRSLMAAWPGLQARLLTRADAAGVPTWMETYARATGPGSGDGIDRALEVAIESAARRLDALIEGERHSEAFDADGAA